MRQALLAAGIVAVGIPVYDGIALALGESQGQQVIPILWKGSIADAFSETWLAILGAILILLAVFLPL